MKAAFRLVETGAQPFTPTFMSVVSPGHVPTAIAHLRERFGWSVREAADRAGISSSTLNRAENGYTIDATTLVKLTAFIRAWWWKERE